MAARAVRRECQEAMTVRRRETRWHLHSANSWRRAGRVTQRRPIRVVIAEGQGLVRAGFRVLLERQEGMRVVGEAATDEDAVAAVRETRPDVVLMDVELPGRGGIEAVRRILAETAPGATRVVMLMTSQTDEAVFGALRAGATGLLLKDTDPDALVEAVRVVADGEALLAPRLARTLVADFLRDPNGCGPRPSSSRS